ncbi:hypothetical protein OIU77_016911 [Salix suchowensis]|uniref:Uncharacterized protein n=1 Tax=Salix suchowensis TaxID=1278906 RepID=A0ABQ8ZMD5_9ROSI|nr:hypothetical protein OIU77_016911 [Salix suchowensis]
MAHVSDIKLIRTDTTLDLSQKAEKGMSVPALRFAFYSLCPHAYIHFLLCGISEGQQQSPACRSSRCENGFLRSKARRNRRLKQIRETCVGACSELTGELISNIQRRTCLFFYKTLAKAIRICNAGPAGCSSLAYGAMQELGPFRVHRNGKTLYRNRTHGIMG